MDSMDFKYLINELKYTSKKFKLSILIALCMFLLVLFALNSEWGSMSEEINIPVDQTIEIEAKEMGINITQDEDMTYMFSSSKGFGGAGGQGSAARFPGNISLFLEGANKNKEIYFFMKEEQDIVTKQYYFEQTVLVAILEQKYYPSDAIVYDVVQFNESNIYLKKDRPAFDAFTLYLLASAITGVIVYVILYIVLWTLESVFIKYLWNRYKKSKEPKN